MRALAESEEKLKQEKLARCVAVNACCNALNSAVMRPAFLVSHVCRDRELAAVKVNAADITLIAQVRKTRVLRALLAK